jgi:copper chaperone
MSIPLWVVIIGAAFIVGMMAGANPTPGRSPWGDHRGSPAATGPGMSGELETVRLRVETLPCPHCAATVVRKLAAIPGVTIVRMGIGDSEAGVDYDPTQTAPAALAAAVRQAGFGVEEMEV